MGAGHPECQGQLGGCLIHGWHLQETGVCKPAQDLSWGVAAGLPQQMSRVWSGAGRSRAAWQSQDLLIMHPSCSGFVPAGMSSTSKSCMPSWSCMSSRTSTSCRPCGEQRGPGAEPRLIRGDGQWAARGP